MVPIKLFDVITIKKIEKGIILKTNRKEIQNRDNIVLNAAKLFFDKTKINNGAEIILQKKIPISAGLGGGSSDAASTLLGLNQIYSRPLNFNQLCKLALNIGTDVPFFLYRSACFAQGRGEILSPIRTPKLYIVLYTPSYGVSTKWAYTKIQNSKFKIQNSWKGAGLTDADFSLMILKNRLVRNDLRNINALITNSFESLVFTKHPDLLAVKYSLLNSGAYTASLSGSGSSLFGLYEQSMKRTLKKNLCKVKIKAFFTESI